MGVDSGMPHVNLRPISQRWRHRRISTGNLAGPCYVREQDLRPISQRWRHLRISTKNLVGPCYVRGRDLITRDNYNF